MKLDLSSFQKNQDPALGAGLVRRDKIAFFDKECSKVADHIYLGGGDVAQNREILKQHGITMFLIVWVLFVVSILSLILSTRRFGYKTAHLRIL